MAAPQATGKELLSEEEQGPTAKSKDRDTVCKETIGRDVTV